MRLPSPAALAAAVRAAPLADELMLIDGQESPFTRERLPGGLWEVATETGFIEQDGTRGPARLDGSDEEALAAWGDVCYLLLHPEELGEQPVTLTLLQLFFAREPLAAGLLESDSPGVLPQLGLVDVLGDRIALSPLGLWAGRELARELLDQDVPVMGSCASQDAAGLLHALRAYPEQERDEELAGWLAGRDPAKAAQEIAAVLPEVSPLARAVGVELLASRFGDDGARELEGLLASPRIGSLVAARLGRADREPVPEEISWVLVDMAAGLLEYGGALEVVIESVSMGMGPGELADTIAILAFGDHPRTEEVLRVFADHHQDGQVSASARKALRRHHGLTTPPS